MNIIRRHVGKSIRTIGFLAVFCLAAANVAPAYSSEILSTLIFGGQSFGGTVEAFNPVTGTDSGALNLSGLASPSGIAVASDGSFYVTNEAVAPLNVVHYSSTGTVLGTLTVSGPDTSNTTAGDVRIGPDGNVYVSNIASGFGGGSVYEFSGSIGSLIGTPVSGLTATAGTAFQSGNLYVADAGDVFSGNSPGGNAVYVHSGSNTTSIIQYGNQGPGNTGPYLDSPDGLLFLPNGRLLVGDLGGNDILEYTLNGTNAATFDQIFATLTPTPTQSFGSNAPGGMVLSPDGNDVFVAALGQAAPTETGFPDGEILEYDLNGNLVSAFNTGTSLQGPADLAFVPEPSSWILAIFGGAGALVLIGRRRRLARRVPVPATCNKLPVGHRLK